MIYSALCIDNRHYFEKGTITVRIFEYYNQPRMIKKPKNKKVVPTNIDDLSSNPSELLALSKRTGNPQTTSSTISSDFEALIFAPLGGGRNYGLFALPKINEKGIVSFLDGSFSKPVWMGSYFSPVRDPTDLSKIEAVNSPSDVPDADETGASGNDMDGGLAGSANLDAGTDTAGSLNSIILRTKNTEYDESNKTKLNWKDRASENLVSIDENKVRVRHFTGWNSGAVEKYQEILLYGDSSNSGKGTVKLEAEDLTSGSEVDGVVTLTGDNFKVVITNQSNVTTLEFNGNDATLTTTDGSDTSSFNLVGDQATLTVADTNITGNVDIDENVNIDGDETVGGDVDITGDLTVGTGSQPMTLYTSLETAISNLLVMLNTHVHSDPMSGSTGPALPPIATVSTSIINLSTARSTKSSSD